MAALRQLVGSTDGSALIEYALLLSFIALAAILAVEALGDTVSAAFNSMAEKLR